MRNTQALSSLLKVFLNLRAATGVCILQMLTPDVFATEKPSLFEMDLNQLLELRVVTAASGFEQNLKDAPAAVTVIKAEEWQAVGATTLTEAVRRLTGLHIGITSVGIGYEKIEVRGFSGSFGQQVLLLVDGQPFRSPREGGAPWAQLFPLASYKRIEIIRGSGSAIYGADAVGGIINLVSYEPGEAPKRLALGVGQNDYRHASLTWSGKHNDHQWNIALSGQQQDSDSRRTIEGDLQTLYDLAAGTSASLAPGPIDSGYEANTLRASWRFKNLKLSYLDWSAPDFVTGVGISQALDNVGNVKLRTQMLETNYDLSELVKGHMDIRFAWHKFSVDAYSVLFPAGAEVLLDEQGNVQLPGASLFIPNLTSVTFPDGVIGSPGSDSHSLSLQLSHIFDFNERHKFRWAVGAESSDISATEAKNFGPGVYDGTSTTVDGTLTDITGTEYIYMPDADRDTYFVALQDQFKIAKRWVATVGVRHDHYSDFGSTTNPRLGIVWHTTERFTLKAYTGTAFRAPSFIELYSKNNPTALGSPDLSPEKAFMYDLGMSATTQVNKNLELTFNLFHNEARDLITYVPQNTALVAQNAGELKVRGVEYGLQWRGDDHIKINWNLTALDPYESVGVDTSSIARVTSIFNVFLYREPYHAFIGAKWVADRRRDELDPREEIADNFSVDAKLEYAGANWSVGVVAENLFDQDLKEPASQFVVEDYPLARRSVKLQWAYQF